MHNLKRRDLGISHPIMKYRSILFILAIFFVGVVAYNLYYFPSPENVQPQIQTFINNEYGSRFRVATVTKDYSPDLFKTPWGYSVILEDTNGLKFGNVYVQDNEIQGWITYGGTDVEAEYRNVRKAQDEAQ